jgi:hypothetical protein
LFLHCARRAASRACWTAGKSNAINTPMMAMTTSSSINVNPAVLRREWTMWEKLRVEKEVFVDQYGRRRRCGS